MEISKELTSPTRKIHFYFSGIPTTKSGSNYQITSTNIKKPRLSISKCILSSLFEKEMEHYTEVSIN